MFNYIRKKMKVAKQSASMFAKVETIIRLLKENEIEKAEREIAKIALDYCSKVESKTMGHREVSGYFLDLDQAIDRSSASNILREEVRYLILQGILFGEYGTKFGPDLDLIKKLANEILAEDIEVK